MKIEVCEHLVASWLRHCKGCQIVQTNWRPSPVMAHIDDDERAKLTSFVEAVKVIVNDADLDRASPISENVDKQLYYPKCRMFFADRYMARR